MIKHKNNFILIVKYDYETVHQIIHQNSHLEYIYSTILVDSWNYLINLYFQTWSKHWVIVLISTPVITAVPFFTLALASSMARRATKFHTSSDSGKCFIKLK